MKKTINRTISILLSLILCFSFVAGINLPAQAATVNYVKNGSYIYNWGVRETEATFMSPNAEKFYDDNDITYAELAELSGSSSESSVPSSALYKKLNTLMKSNHSYVTSYNATRSLFQYTDCQNSGKTSKKISSFYSGDAIGPSWDGGGTWNREHCWPNSKGDKAGDGENDIMMLRPASVSENSSRGNKAYGKSSGYYNPNSESGGKYDLRGDVARIVLYQYVRWNCTNTGSGYNPNGIFGTKGVIESKTLLLDWMEEDPVDTWELGRNDSVESITGTRNVFVDYPELAFILFGEEIPSDYTTPSGEAKEDDKPACTQHSFDNDCDASCNACSYVRPVTHKYSTVLDTSCDACGQTREVKTWKISFNKTGVFDITPSKTLSGFTSKDLVLLDKQNNEVKYNDTNKGWPVIKDETYTIVLTKDFDNTSGLIWLKSKKADTIFPDTYAGDWYNDAVTYAVGSGIMTGYQNGKFGTSDSIQRQDFLVMLARYEGVDLTQYEGMSSGFNDVGKGSYYETAVIWGVQNGITTGYTDGSGKFGVGDKINREQLVTFLYRYAKNCKGLNVTVSANKKAEISSKYKDFSTVSSYSQDAVYWAIANGVINGKTDTTIVPKGNAQRCEVAKIMYNIYSSNLFANN